MCGLGRVVRVRDPNIHGFVGYWGSGKTYLMCREIDRRIEQSDERVVVGSNFGYRGDDVVHLTSMREAIAFASMPTPGWRKILALDEVGILARARGFSTWPPAADVVFQQGRKLKLSLFWTATHWRVVDVNIRRVTDLVSECSSFFHVPCRTPGVTRRPLLISERLFESPDPETGNLPDAANGRKFYRFRMGQAERYDTLALVSMAAEQMVEQAALADEILQRSGFDVRYGTAGAGSVSDGS